MLCATLKKNKLHFSQLVYSETNKKKTIYVYLHCTKVQR